MAAFPQGWNDWDLGWKEFNGNGYVSGFLNYFAHLNSNNQDDETGKLSFKPTGSFLDGWDKDIPIEFFESKMTEPQMKDVVDVDHKPKKYAAAAAPSVLAAGMVKQQWTLDP